MSRPTKRLKSPVDRNFRPGIRQSRIALVRADVGVGAASLGVIGKIAASLWALDAGLVAKLDAKGPDR